MRDIEQFANDGASILESALTLGLTEVVASCQTIQTLQDELVAHQIRMTQAGIGMESALVGLENIFSAADNYLKEWYRVR